MTPCVEPQKLAALLDGELTENDATAVRAHLAGCATCATQLADLEAVITELRAPVVSRELDAARVNANVARAIGREPRQVRRWPFVAALAVAASGAGFFAWQQRDDRGAFFARGGSPQEEAAARREVGVTVWVDGKPSVPGQHVTRDTRYQVGFTTLPAKRTYYLFVIAVDAVGDVHWLEPTFLDAHAPPQSTPLPAGKDERFPRTVALEAPAAGPLTLIECVSEQPIDARRVEAVPPANRTVLGFAEVFPEASFGAWRLTVEP